MKLTQFLLFILFTLFVVTVSRQAFAQGNFAAKISTTSTMNTNQQSSKQQVRIKSSKQAAQLAQSRFGGKVLKVQAQKSGYRVKLIKEDGHIIAVFVDAKSGLISGR